MQTFKGSSVRCEMKSLCTQEGVSPTTGLLHKNWMTFFGGYCYWKGNSDCCGMCWAQWSADVVQDTGRGTPTWTPNGSGDACWPVLGALTQKYVQTQAEKLCECPKIPEQAVEQAAG